MPNPVDPSAGIVLENPSQAYGLPLQDAPNLNSGTLSWVDTDNRLPVFNVLHYYSLANTGASKTLTVAAIQDAADAANAAGGGIVWFPVGNYLCGTVNTDPGAVIDDLYNVHFAGPGRLYRTDPSSYVGQPGRCLTIEDSDLISLDGLRFEHTNYDGTKRSGIGICQLTRVTNLEILRCYVIKSNDNCFRLTYCEDIFIHHNRMPFSGGTPLQIENTNRGVISDNYINMCGDHGIGLDAADEASLAAGGTVIAPCTDLVVSNNVVCNAGSAGINASGGARISITNNVIYRTLLEGILLSIEQQYGDLVDCDVKGNLIIEAGQYVYGGDPTTQVLPRRVAGYPGGIGITHGVGRGTIQPAPELHNLTISENTIIRPKQNFIRMGNASDMGTLYETSITNNRFYGPVTPMTAAVASGVAPPDPGQTGYTQGYTGNNSGIYIINADGDLEISGNRCIDAAEEFLLVSGLIVSPRRGLRGDLVFNNNWVKDCKDDPAPANAAACTSVAKIGSGYPITAQGNTFLDDSVRLVYGIALLTAATIPSRNRIGNNRQDALLYYQVTTEMRTDFRVKVEEVRYTGGNVVTNSTTWTGLGGGAFDITLEAQTGDYILFELNGLWSNEAVQGCLDVASIIGGGAANFWSKNGGLDNAHYGNLGWFGDTAVFAPISGSIGRTLLAGDCANGNVTVRPYFRGISAGNKGIFANADQPLQMRAFNFGNPST